MKDRIINPKESQTRWQFLSCRPIEHNHQLCISNKTSKGSDDDEADVDPFSCDDLTVPSSKSAIESVISNAISEWEELDQRRISPVIDGTEERILKRARRSRITLPKNFDYATTSPTAPSAEGNESKEDKVICLIDPTVHLNYSSELWKLFAAVPTEEEVEVPRKVQHLSTLKKEIETAIKEYTRVDCHALSRLRLRSLHHFPALDDGRKEGAVVARIECWNRMLKRGSSPDSHRFEAEFLCKSDSDETPSATLLDVHKAILSQYSSDTDEKTVNDGGLFFIEDTFYIHGDQHYTEPIVNWLNDKCNGVGVQFPRKEYLGMSFTADVPPIKLMSTAYLYNMHFRLAVRYVHFCRNTIESIFLFSDIRTVLKQKETRPTDIAHDKSITTPTYPRIIDTFTRTYANTVCQGCNHSVAAVVCCNDELSSGEPTFMCSNCYWKLHYDEHGHLRYNNFDVYSILDLELVHAAANTTSDDTG